MNILKTLCLYLLLLTGMVYGFTFHHQGVTNLSVFAIWVMIVISLIYGSNDFAQLETLLVKTGTSE